MEIKQFRNFATIAEQGSFTRASAKLELSQPILSRQMAKFEQELGSTLFHRTGRGIVLTEAGHGLLTYARQMTETIQECNNAMEGLRGEPTGKISVGMPMSVARSMAVPLVVTIRRELPLVSISIVEGNSVMIRERLVAGEMDIGLAYGIEDARGMVREELLDDEHALIGPLENPVGIVGEKVTLSETQRVPLIILGGDRFQNVKFHEAVERRKLLLAVTSLSATLAIVEGGLAHAILPLKIAQALAAANHVLCWKIVEPTPVRRLNLMFSKQAAGTIKIQRMTNLIKEHVAAYAVSNPDMKSS